MIFSWVTGLPGKSLSVWCSWMYRNHLATNVFLYLSIWPSDGELCSVVVTNLVSSDSHSATKNFDKKRRPLSVRTAFGVQYKMIQCIEDTVAATDAVTLAARIALASLLHSSFYPTSKRVLNIVFIKSPNLFMRTNSDGPPDVSSCIHRWFL